MYNSSGEMIVQSCTFQAYKLDSCSPYMYVLQCTAQDDRFQNKRESDFCFRTFVLFDGTRVANDERCDLNCCCLGNCFTLFVLRNLHVAISQFSPTNLIDCSRNQGDTRRYLFVDSDISINTHADNDKERILCVLQ